MQSQRGGLWNLEFKIQIQKGADAANSFAAFFAAGTVTAALRAEEVFQQL